MLEGIQKVCLSVKTLSVIYQVWTIFYVIVVTVNRICVGVS